MLGKFPFRRSPEGARTPFHPHRLLCDWDDGNGVRVSDATTGVAVFGSTGSGKTSAIGSQLAHAYLAAGFGGLVLCAKGEERRQWQAWAAETGRSGDLVIVDTGGAARFNWMDYEASRAGAGAGIAINIVAMLDELGGVAAGDAGRAEGGDGAAKFFRDSLHHLNTNAVDLALLAGLRVSLPLLRSIILSAPITPAEAASPEWQEGRGVCATLLRDAGSATHETGDREARADFVEVENYWLHEYPAIGDRTRSIVTLCFSMMARPFLTRPIHRLFSADTTVTPEAAFDGKIIVVDLPVQEFRLAGRMANLAWKYCFQIAVMRRQPSGQPGDPLRPVFLWADEAQNFVTPFDAEYQAVARAAGGCTVYLTQSRESYLRVLGSEAAVDSLLGNLQIKAFCQSSSPETNAWGAKLLGERWSTILSTSVGHSGRAAEDHFASSNVNMSEQRRHFVEPAEFTVLRRGGRANDYEVEVIVYLGGYVFSDGLPYRRIRIDQRTAHARLDSRNTPISNPLGGHSVMLVMAGSLLVFLRRDIGVRLLPRGRFVWTAIVLIFIAWNEWPFDKNLALFGLVVLLLVCIHHFRHMRRINRGVPEWHSYDTGKSLLFGLLPLPRTFVQVVIEPAACGLFGWWLSWHGRPSYLLDWRVNSTELLGWWITLASAMLFTLESAVRAARHEMMLNVGDTIIETMHYRRSAEFFTAGMRGAGGPTGEARAPPPRESWFAAFRKARQAAQQSRRAQREAGERQRQQQEDAQARGGGQQEQQREGQGEQDAWRDPTAGRMTQEQALEILELKPGASASDIRAAYNRLMQKVHPDTGGSTFFAKQLNLARDTLLRPQRKSG